MPTPPKPTAAIIGASSLRHKFGNISLRAHEASGYQVYPVNLRGGTVEGHVVYHTVSEIPIDRIDRISVYLPPRGTMALLDELAKRPHGELWLNPGTYDDAVLRRAEELGLQPTQGCSIVDLGRSPSEFADH